MVFDHEGKVISRHQLEHEQIYPQVGWVEHCPMEIWECTQHVITTTLEKNDINPEDISALGITNQRETTIIWDKRTGRPDYNAIVWQCTRTRDICNVLAKGGRSGILPLQSRSALGNLLLWFQDQAALG